MTLAMRVGVTQFAPIALGFKRIINRECHARASKLAGSVNRAAQRHRVSPEMLVLNGICRNGRNRVAPEADGAIGGAVFEALESERFRRWSK